MKNEILDANEALVSKILYDFDHELQLKFSSSLFQFILATDEISYGMFHDTIRQVWRDAGPLGLRRQLKAELADLENVQARKAQKASS